MRRLLGFRLEIIGILALAVVVFLVSSLVAFLGHAFSNEITVTATIPITGAPLPVNAEVKVRGVVIGRVSDAKVSGDSGLLTVKLDPAKAKLLPENVTSRALPSTLFGHEFLDLVLPDQPVGTLRAGAAIAEDTNKESVETQRLLADTFPLLSSLKPTELNAALTAVATALAGRGDKLGTTIDQLDGYLKQLSPHYPELAHDLRSVSTVAGSLDAATPDLLGASDDLTTTAQTFVDERSALRTTLASGAAAATALDQLFTDNRSRLITLTSSLRTVLRTADANRPGLARTVKGLESFFAALERVSGGHPYFTVQVLLTGNQRGTYTAADCPRYPGANGPNCPGAAASQAVYAGSAGPVGSAPEQATVNALAAPLLGVTAAQVPSAAEFLLGPLLRGATLDLAAAS
jgi:phospholipid/cholesterol/gamma-HCH transport system substrate-binding protein